MAQPKKPKRLSPGEEPFPATETTMDEPRLRADLDDPRAESRDMGSSISDQEIAGRVMAAIAKDRRLALSRGTDGKMNVNVEGGIVTISGVVDSAADRMVAEELAEAVPGVRKVETALTVSVDQYLDDADLNERIRAALDEAGLAGLGSSVSNGIARLVGTVDKLSEEERAAHAAAKVKGIRDVTSSIKVQMPEHADEIDLLSLVSQQLNTNNVVLMDPETRVEDGIIYISGKVESLQALRKVKRLISEIEGVRGIRDRLEVDETLFSHWKARTKLSTGR